MPLFSAVVTCKGRLEHLKVSLPALMALDEVEVIVVDYDCPDGAGDWVSDAHPAAKLVRVADKPLFSGAHARNLGIAQATAAWLVMLDADVIPSPTLPQILVGLLGEGVFLRPASTVQESGGFLVAARADVVAIGGYDEVFEGYGSEDRDIVSRLEQLGRRGVSLPSGQLRFIQHADALRGRFHAVGDPNVNMTVNRAYWHAKTDLAALGVSLDEAGRRELYQRIRNALLAPGEPGPIEIVFDRDPVAGKRLVRSLRLQLVGPG
jgi:glycosyltransferase involved in cell wall biosynthesis